MQERKELSVVQVWTSVSLCYSVKGRKFKPYFIIYLSKHFVNYSFRCSNINPEKQVCTPFCWFIASSSIGHYGGSSTLTTLYK